MNPIHCIIVDDELNSRETLRSLVRLCAPDIIIHGEAASVREARKLIEEFEPEIIFLDIQMPGENGFDLLKSYPQPAFKVIFTTAFQHFAAKAFRYSALDYLLKPIDPDELKQAVEKYKANRHPTEKNQVDLLQDNWEKLKQLEPGQGPRKPDKDMKLALAMRDGIYFVLLKDIIWCEGLGAYTKFHLHNQHPVIISKVLKEFEEILEEFFFFRVHKSSLVNLEYVKKYTRGEGGQIWLTDGTEIEVSRRRKDTLMELLSKIALSGPK